MPPYEAFQKLVAYANLHGKHEGAPYLKDAGGFISESKWLRMRSIWNHQHGLTNVWDEPSLRTSERLKDAGGKYVHTNQKPLALMQRQILATTDVGGTIWEPFGGVCSASVAAKQLGRNSYAAELDGSFQQLAQQRINETVAL
jgi:DNA modification methylase